LIPKTGKQERMEAMNIYRKLTVMLESLGRNGLLVLTVVAAATVAVSLAAAAALLSAYEIVKGWTGSELVGWVTVTLIILLLGQKFLRFIIFLLGDTLAKIKTPFMGVITRFGKRTGRVLGEGLHLKWPLVDKVILVDNSPVGKEIEVDFPTSNEMFLGVLCYVRYRRDPNVKRKGKSVCIEVSDERVAADLTAGIQEKLSALGNILDADVLRKSQHAISDFLECWLRLKTQPQEGRGVEARDIPAFYTEQRDEVRRRILENTNRERSAIESLDGIEVEEFRIKKIDFTEETKRAMEAKAQAAERAKALKIRAEKVAELIRAGVTSQEAIDEVDTALDPRIVPTKVSVQTRAQFVALGNIPGLGRSGRSSEEETPRRGGKR
jgi:regulator of protease activity HflC (stomatin/prohibitin superfamily)